MDAATACCKDPDPAVPDAKVASTATAGCQVGAAAHSAVVCAGQAANGAGQTFAKLAAG
jgi:hypothetical protein